MQYFRAAKAEISLDQQQLAVANASRQRFEFHQTRVQTEKLQQEQRRAARAALSQQPPDQPLAVNNAQATIAAALARVKAKKLEQAQPAAADTQSKNDDEEGS